MDRQSRINAWELVGTNLGRYRIEEVVSSGGMGAVYRAHDVLLGRDVAVKVLHSNQAADQKGMNYLFSNARNLASLRHSAIVSVTDVEHEAGYTFLVMQLVDGRTLEQELEAEGRLSVERVADLLDQICDAVAYAHDRRILHRDLKPGNIMLVGDGGRGTIRILNFGVARAIEDAFGVDPRISELSYYASPEQLLGASIDQRSDIYSLGIMTFELLTGEYPFKVNSLEELIHRTVTMPPPLRQLCPSLSQAIEDVILKALAKEPSQRYQNATDLARDFRRAADATASANSPSPVSRELEVRSYGRLSAFTRTDWLKLLIVRFAKWAGWLSSLDQDVLDEYINFQERRAAQHGVW